MTRDEIVKLIIMERERQERLFPDQHLPMVVSEGDRIMHRAVADSLRDRNNVALKFGGVGLSWMTVLGEELWEAGGAVTVADAIEELTQLAALCIRAIEDIQHKGKVDE